MYNLIFVFGVATFLSLITTVLVGMRVIKMKFKNHKRLGLLTLMFAILHAGLIIFSQYFY